MRRLLIKTFMTESQSRGIGIAVLVLITYEFMSRSTRWTEEAIVVPLNYESWW